jgi:predicted kinase
MRESSGRIALAVREATAATENRRALLARRNRLTRLIYWTDRMIEELEAQNQSTQRSRPVKVLDELFEIQARLLELKVGDLAPELRQFDETVDDYYGWAGYQTERLDPAG